jgi:hypothetical protein
VGLYVKLEIRTVAFSQVVCPPPAVTEAGDMVHEDLIRD